MSCLNVYAPQLRHPCGSTSTERHLRGTRTRNCRVASPLRSHGAVAARPASAVRPSPQTQLARQAQPIILCSNLNAWRLQKMPSTRCVHCQCEASLCPRSPEGPAGAQDAQNPRAPCSANLPELGTSASRASLPWLARQPGGTEVFHWGRGVPTWARLAIAQLTQGELL